MVSHPGALFPTFWGFLFLRTGRKKICYTEEKLNYRTQKIFSGLNFLKKNVEIICADYKSQ